MVKVQREAHMGLEIKMMQSEIALVGAGIQQQVGKCSFSFKDECQTTCVLTSFKGANLLTWLAVSPIVFMIAARYSFIFRRQTYMH